jgi:hypothetical protein
MEFVLLFFESCLDAVHLSKEKKSKEKKDKSLLYRKLDILVTETERK